MESFKAKHSLRSTLYISIFLLQIIHVLARDIVSDRNTNNTNVSDNHDLPRLNWPFGIKPYQVSIHNALPDNAYFLRVHCASKDDEIGYHDLLVGESFSWRFHMNFWGSTMYFCHFWWIEKDKAFHVFDASIAENYCGTNENNNNCHWYVEKDGFYFTNLDSRQNLQKLQDW